MRDRGDVERQQTACLATWLLPLEMSVAKLLLSIAIAVLR
jgi:hypothetical protein